MVSPRHGEGVCTACLNFTRGFQRCYSCARGELWLAAVVPISYSIGGEQLHRALMGYKRLGGNVAMRLTAELAAVLWRFLAAHERCVATAAGVAAFELVTTVPSGERERDVAHPLRRMVGELIGVTRPRYRPLLCRSSLVVSPREIHSGKFEVLGALHGEPILLIDDTWTTGASARSAAAALKLGGSGPVAAVVIGRHINREWHDTDRRLRALGAPFDWSRCAVCCSVEKSRTDASRGPGAGPARGLSPSQPAREPSRSKPAPELSAPQPARALHS
jgi:hypothetical protein